MDQNKIAVTTLDELKRYNEGDIVSLPPFGAGKPFVAKLRRPSMLVLAKCGKIPNALLAQANAMFFGEVRSGKHDDDALSKLFDVIEVMCESAFIEPTYQEIKDAGITLTDQQYLAVYNYTQEGTKSLSSFRKE